MMVYTHDWLTDLGSESSITSPLTREFSRVDIVSCSFLQLHFTLFYRILWIERFWLAQENYEMHMMLQSQ